jgi:hypothetical protein
MPLTPEQKQLGATRPDREPSQDNRVVSARTVAAAPPATPELVDNRRFHGPIHDQGARDTCGAFATAAAVEGFYRRLDPSRFRDLDLSEQWTHHIYNITELLGKPAKAIYRENQMGGWPGARAYYELLALQFYGAPTEGALGYNPDTGVERLGDENDPEMRQWTVDNYNLDARHLPVGALLSSPYRPTGVEVIIDALHRPGDLEAVLAAGYDVVTLMQVVSPMYTNAEKAWIAGPGSQVSFQHIVLIVGYNRAGRYYIARNSWGGRDGVDGGYTRISYDYLATYGLYGCYITGVAEPEQEGTRGRQYLGRWSIPKWGGVLDIYRLPGFYTLSRRDPGGDFRIGTYYQGDQAWRVNGTWAGEDLGFWIDFSNPNAPRDSLVGSRYAARVLIRESETLYGVAARDGGVEEFRGTRQTQTF